MRKTWLIALLVVPLALGLLIGCGGQAGKPRSPVAKVSGEVTVNGQPLEKGSLLFVPDPSKKTKGRAAHGTIANGKVDKLTTYEDGDGAIIGWHKVEIHATKGEDPQTAVELIPPQYNSQTTLSFEVKPDKNTFKFDLTIPNFKP